MATYDNLRNAVAAIIEGVPGSGKVHNRIRYADQWSGLLELFSVHNIDPDKPDQILGWTVSRTSIEPSDSDSHFGAQAHLHHFQLQGMMGFSDLADSEGYFQDLIDRVIHALESDRNLWGEADIQEGTRRPTVNTIDMRKFGSALCHYTDLDFIVPTVDAFG